MERIECQKTNCSTSVLLETYERLGEKNCYKRINASVLREIEINAQLYSGVVPDI